ncbi:MAG: 6-carboxytetrahydropterin synthase [Planctomycetota bacterium]|nr:MAG: 6-carboxytetrahydropterin synthase [Planctomycetota bacterium]
MANIYTDSMYEVTVQHTFSAAHAITLGGQAEPIHGHDWRVHVTLAGQSLDDDGLLCDFHAVEEALGAICQPFHNRSLNEITPFDRLNPTAELVARHIADRLALSKALSSDRLHIASVSVEEAPGCTATYRPERRP